jgi:hypothetical protein
MHTEAAQWIGRVRSWDPVDVLELGSRNVNGSPRSLFPCARYWGIDIEPGAGVDEVADAATWRSDRRYDVVICAEVAEHTPLWRDILVTARHHLSDRGVFVFTAAGPGREPHSAVDGGPIVGEEHYRNIAPADLDRAFEAAGFNEWTVDVAGKDVRGMAWL